MSFPFDGVSGPMRSTLIISHGLLGISLGCSGAALGHCLGFAV